MKAFRKTTRLSPRQDGFSPAVGSLPESHRPAGGLALQVTGISQHSHHGGDGGSCSGGRSGLARRPAGSQ